MHHRTCLMVTLLVSSLASSTNIDIGVVDEDGIVNPAGSRNLVLGIEYNIAEIELRVFLASLRGSGCQANVVLFSGQAQEHTQRLAERFQATLIHYDFAALNQTHGPVGVHRFHLYRRFLEARRTHYDLVLHTDVRDVMFQDDPFERIEAHGGGVFFLESNHLLIGTSPTNRCVRRAGICARTSVYVGGTSFWHGPEPAGLDLRMEQWTLRRCVWMSQVTTSSGSLNLRRSSRAMNIAIFVRFHPTHRVTLRFPVLHILSRVVLVHTSTSVHSVRCHGCLLPFLLHAQLITLSGASNIIPAQAASVTMLAGADTCPHASMTVAG